MAFRIFKKLLEDKHGAAAKNRIYATTDRSHGALRQLAQREGYETFIVPRDIGGRYSVLTAVGLLPMAAAGIDVEAVLSGARTEMTALFEKGSANPAWQYAGARQRLYRLGKKIEILASFEPAFRFMGEWWKQLFGESEGKDGIGIFPAYAELTADLHSLGQYMQDGERILTETIVSFRKPRRDMPVPFSPDDADGLGYLAGKELGYIASQALRATKTAHMDGGVPVFEIQMERLCEEAFGALVYFFEFSCALSGYLSGVNPFDQPGVEAYKKNMFALLGKPGYEDLRKRLMNV